MLKTLAVTGYNVHMSSQQALNCAHNITGLPATEMPCQNKEKNSQKLAELSKSENENSDQNIGW